MSKKCFVVCPIGDENSPTRNRSDQLFEYIITPVCKECDFEAIRVDKLTGSDSINETIVKHLIESDLVIADLTDHNPNAFFEIGYRMALKKNIINLCEKGTKIPFDISTIRTLSYVINDLAGASETKTRLKATIQSLDFDQQDNTISLSEIHKNSSNNAFNSQILQGIFDIQDQIKELGSKLSIPDTSAISVLADKLANSKPKSDDAVLMETLLPHLLSNPKSMENFLQLVEKVNTSK